MIRTTFIISLALLSCSHNSETTFKDKEYTDLVLTYREPVFVGCGIFALAYRFKFRSVSNNNDLTCIIRCPDTYAEVFFEQGKTYSIKLSNVNIQDSLKDYSIANTFVDDKDPVYLVTKIKNAVTLIKNTE